MLLEKTYLKDESGRSAAILDKVFETCVKESKLEQDPTEHPVSTIIRTYGEKWWNVNTNNVKDYDIINVITQDEASFNIDVIKRDSMLATQFTQWIAYVFQGFSLACGGEKFTKEFAENYKANFVVYAGRQNFMRTVTLYDFAKVADEVDGIPSNLRNLDEIMKKSIALDEFNNKIKQMQADPKNTKEAIQEELTKRNKLMSETVALHSSICESFFEILKNLMNQFSVTKDLDVSDVYDIHICFDRDINDENNKDIKKELMIAQIHSMDHVLINKLKNEYGI